MEEALIKRILPHSIEAEKAVIGSMLMDRDAILIASETLTSDDFYQNQYGIIFDAIVELCRDEKSKVTNAFLITKQLDDFGIAKHETKVPILRIPAIAFLYLLGKAEADGQNGKM